MEQKKGISFPFFGVPVRVDATGWLLIALLFLWGSAAATNFLGAVTIASGILFSLLAHERMHAFAAARFGIGCKGITIFALGGGAHVVHTGHKPAQVFWIAAAGPLTSVLFGATFVFLGNYSNWLGSAASDIVLFVGVVNIALAVFNGLLPLFPLDGGRIAHAIAWKITKSRERGMRIAYRLSCALIVILLSLSAWSMLNGSLDAFSFLWRCLLGWFLWNAGKYELRREVKNITPEP